MHKTEDLDCQVCHEESLKTENSSTKNDKTGHGVQRDRDLPLRADGAWNDTSSMSDTSFSILGPRFAKIQVKGTDINNGALYGEMTGKTLVGLSLLNQSFSCKCPTLCVGKTVIKLVWKKINNFASVAAISHQMSLLGNKIFNIHRSL